VEDLVSAKYGGDYLQTKNAKTALSKMDTEIRSLKRKIAQLEKRKAELLAMLNS
jgi:phage shock protein A